MCHRYSVCLLETLVIHNPHAIALGAPVHQVVGAREAVERGDPNIHGVTESL